MKVIVHSESRFPCVITFPIWSDRRPEETDEAFIERVKATAVPAGATGVRVVDSAYIPADAYGPDEHSVPRCGAFRDALKPDLTFDMPKARNVQRNRMRAARAPLLAALDIEYIRADEAGDAPRKASIAEEKRLLRDVTGVPEIDAAKDIQELKAVWPAVLEAQFRAARQR
jgi:hypothetical protein